MEVNHMDVAIVYESLFGNTRTVAEAIATGFRGSRPEAKVAVLEVNQAAVDVIGQVDVLIVGGPTHARRTTTPRTRRVGLRYWGGWPVSDEGDQDQPRQGVREWLVALPDVASRRLAAAFDTRLESAFAGGAARSISRHLHDRGYEILTEPNGFIVGNGPAALKPGEEDRARSWGATLARQCSTAWLSEISTESE
jgi:hypothetical protein